MRMDCVLGEYTTNYHLTYIAIATTYLDQCTLLRSVISPINHYIAAFPPPQIASSNLAYCQWWV